MNLCDGEKERQIGETFRFMGRSYVIERCDINSGCKKCAGRDDIRICLKIGRCSDSVRSDSQSIIAVSATPAQS